MLSQSNVRMSRSVNAIPKSYNNMEHSIDGFQTAALGQIKAI